MGDPVSVPEVFTLVPRDDRPAGPRAFLEALLERQRATPHPPPPGLVFRCWPDGRVTVDGFPDAADACPAVVARVARRAPDLVRLERGRLYVQAANGAAVDVPVGPSPRPGCTRSGRLYLRLADA